MGTSAARRDRDRAARKGDRIAGALDRADESARWQGIDRASWGSLGFGGAGRTSDLTHARTLRTRGESESEFQARLVRACEAADRGERRNIGAMSRHTPSFAYGRDAALGTLERTCKHDGRQTGGTSRDTSRYTPSCKPSHTPHNTHTPGVAGRIAGFVEERATGIHAMLSELEQARYAAYQTRLMVEQA